MSIGNNLSFQPLNSTTVRILGDTEKIVPHYYNEELLSLELPTKKIISLGEIFKIRRAPYKVNIIKKIIVEDILYYDLIVAEKTKTSLFLLPMLGGERKLLFYDSLFINAFIGTHKKKDCIKLLYRNSLKKSFKEFAIVLQRLKLFITLEAPSPSHVLFTFKIPKKYQKDFNKFKLGKYSKMDDVYKLQILDFHRFDIDGTMGQILFKSKERRQELEEQLDVELPQDSELYSIMNEKEEKFNLNYYF
tara:strand:+ start:141 stop:881 length:741 start_codon:yes stop_codon:yes gene_type:complete